MGVKTQLSLASLNSLFSSYNFIKLTPTSDGLIDTTFLASSNETNYIVKKFEQASKNQINKSNHFLEYLSLNGLNVSKCLEHKESWYIYERLTGATPKTTNTKHIQALARFLSKMHRLSYKKSTLNDFYESYKVQNLMLNIKIKHYSYYKKLSTLLAFTPQNDGIIHGDIFRDNTVFNGDKLGVFDFIDFGNGSFVFDCAVTLVGFKVKKHNTYFINLFLNTYNQRAPKKITKIELLRYLSITAKFYALLRIEHYNSTKKAKKLL